MSKDKVFGLVRESFQRVAAPWRPASLSLVRSFVELHGGKVRVDPSSPKARPSRAIFRIDQAAHRNAGGMTGSHDISLTLADEMADRAFDADLGLAEQPGRCHHPFRRPRRRQDRKPRAPWIRYLASDDALEVPSPTSRLRKPTICRRFRRFMRISTRQRSLELEEIGLSPLPEATVVLIEWPERAPEALPQTESNRASSGAGIRRPAPLKSPAMEKPAAQVARLQGAAAVSR